jgi:hypothetical protein
MISPAISHPFTNWASHIIQVMNDHELVLNPMVTWGSPPPYVYIYMYMYMYMYICSHPFIQFYTCTSRIFDCHLWLPSSYSHFSSFKSSFGVAMLDQRNRSWTGASLTVGCSPWLLKFDGIKMDQDGSRWGPTCSNHFGESGNR